MTLTLPVPPSANRYWKNWQGRMVRSPEATNYLAIVRTLAAPVARRLGWPLQGAVAVSVIWYRAKAAGDLDNRLKCALDALQGVAFLNDAQVRQIEAVMWDTEKSRPRLEIQVHPFLEAPPR